MTSYTINPDKVARLDTVTLHEGQHVTFADGHCAMEVVAWLADLGHTDSPACASPVLNRYTIRLNDGWNDERRQTLKPYLPRMVGTAKDGLDPIRERIAARHVADLMLPWLNLGGLTTEAEAVTAAVGDVGATRRVLGAARDSAWGARGKARSKFENKVHENLMQKGSTTAVAAAAATAAADAADGVVAAAVADVVAAAAAADAAGVVAGAVTAISTAAVAAAVSAAADTSGVVAGADAAAATIAAGGDAWITAFRAARDYYNANPLPVAQEFADLAASQRDTALELLDRLIDARES